MQSANFAPVAVWYKYNVTHTIPVNMILNDLEHKFT